MTTTQKAPVDIVTDILLRFYRTFAYESADTRDIAKEYAYVILKELVDANWTAEKETE